MFDALKQKLEAALAHLQGEVGRFLTLKESIVKMPYTPQRAALLDRQNSIEGEAIALISQAQVLKEKVSKPFDPFAKSSYTDLAPLSTEVVAVVRKLGDVAVRAQAHTLEVQKALGRVPAGSAPAQGGSPMLWAVAVGIAAYAIYKGKKG